MLKSPETYFIETGKSPEQLRNEFLASTFKDAVAALKKRLGADMSQWQYGQTKFKHALIRHPLSAFVETELRNTLDHGPLPRGGNGHTLGANGGIDNQLSGASFRMVADTKDWDQTLMINTPGQSGDPESPYYRNLFEKWAKDQFFPSYFSKPKILQHTKEISLLKPVQ